jgi:hypothetical protein
MQNTKARIRISCTLFPGESWHLHPEYMIPGRLPWRHRARPSATLHEIQVYSEEQTCSNDTNDRSKACQVTWSLITLEKPARVSPEYGA